MFDVHPYWHGTATANSQPESRELHPIISVRPFSYNSESKQINFQPSGLIFQLK